MNPYEKNAVAALSVYLSRGFQALQLLKEGSIDEALDKLRWRHAAFENFKVQDYLAQRENHLLGDASLPGPMIQNQGIRDKISERDQEDRRHVEKMLTDIRKVNEEIACFLTNCKTENQAHLQSLQQLKKVLPMYRSQRSEDVGSRQLNHNV